MSVAVISTQSSCVMWQTKYLFVPWQKGGRHLYLETQARDEGDPGGAREPGQA
ncbi:hypothetical protein CHS0354_022033, partial [Potamilus streckersoni]